MIPLPSVPQLLDPQYNIEDFKPSFVELSTLTIPTPQIQIPNIAHETLPDVNINPPNFSMDTILSSAKDKVEDFVAQYISAYLTDFYNNKVVNQLNASKYKVLIDSLLSDILVQLANLGILPNVTIPTMVDPVREAINKCILDINTIVDKNILDKITTTDKLAALGFKKQTGPMTEVLDRIDYDSWTQRNAIVLQTKAQVINQILQLIANLLDKLIYAQFDYYSYAYRNLRDVYLDAVRQLFYSFGSIAQVWSDSIFDPIFQRIMWYSDVAINLDSIRAEIQANIAATTYQAQVRKYQSQLELEVAFNSALVNLYNLNLAKAKAWIDAEFNANKLNIETLKNAIARVEMEQLEHSKQATLIDLLTTRQKFEIERRRLLALRYLQLLAEINHYKTTIDIYQANVERMSADIDKYSLEYKKFKAKASLAEIQINNVKLQYDLQSQQLNVNDKLLSVLAKLGQSDIQLYDYADRILQKQMQAFEHELQIKDRQAKATLQELLANNRITNFQQLFSYEQEQRSQLSHRYISDRQDYGKDKAAIEQDRIMNTTTNRTNATSAAIFGVARYQHIEELIRACAMAHAKVTATIYEAAKP
jgi:hypothetical protein